METNKNHYFAEKIYNHMNVDEQTFPTMEYGIGVPG